MARGTPLQRKIVDDLGNYLTGRMALNDFREAFLRETWSIDSVPDEPAREMSYEIEHRLAEFSNGDWAEDELKDLLRPLAERFALSA